MVSNVKDRLTAARRQRFVGRVPELNVFDRALDAPELPFHVLYIFGPGGVGKTTLLKVYVAHGEKAGAAVYYLDSRNLEPTPDSFVSELRAALNAGPDDSPVDLLAARPALVEMVAAHDRALARPVGN